NWPDQLSPEIILNRPRQLASTESRQSKPRDRIRLERGAPAFGIRNQPGKCPPAATDPSRWVGGARRWTRARPGVRTSSEPRPGRENASPNRNEIATTSGTRRSDNALRLWFNSRGRTRTCDPTVNSRLLYQLSYAGSSRALNLAKRGGPVNCWGPRRLPEIPVPAWVSRRPPGPPGSRSTPARR